MKIRTVTVELLRAGPRHNQLVSPLTQYLGVCGDGKAGIVTLPFEHREIERRLGELGYQRAGQDASSRAYVLEQTGQQIADILSLVPALSLALSGTSAPADTLTHLRIVLSASELAMLPFEISKTPTDGESAEWLALQARRPVCITRHSRSVNAEDVRWPSALRILFVAGPETPAREHKDALARVLFLTRAAEVAADDRLVVLENATSADIEREVERAARIGRPFSHVHVLAHGVPLDEKAPYSPIGIDLGGELLSGERLAKLLTAVNEKGVFLPAVVTLATCDSGKVVDVVRPGDAGVAHELHEHGIALVVASQFPLSVRASVPFVERFYQGQLAGEHPLLTLYHLRLMLHRKFGHETHDWASIVVYEALPADFAQQQENLRYWQARALHDAALKRVEATVPSDSAERGDFAWDTYAHLVEEADVAGRQLPENGPYALECAGLRAAGHKRLAQVAIQIALGLAVSAPRREQLVATYLEGLGRARKEYWRATKAFLAPGFDPMRRKANLHWLLGQVLSLDAILGRPLDVASWSAARMAAQIDAESGDDVERAWAFVSLSEQALLRLDDPAMSAPEREQYAREAFDHAMRVVDTLGRSAEHAMTTARQFERYATVWSNPQLQELGLDSHAHWQVEGGLVPTARLIVDALRGTRPGSAPPGGQGGIRGSGTASAPLPGAMSSDTTVGGDVGSNATTAVPQTSAAIVRSRDTKPMFAVEMLQSVNGDCVWIEYGDAAHPHRMLVDCGSASAAEVAGKRIGQGDMPLELFVLTHIDADHITGVLPLFRQRALDSRYGDIWFNGWQQLNPFLSVKQGEQFSEMLGDPARALPWNRLIGGTNGGGAPPVVVAPDTPLPTYELAGGMRLTLLSPGPAQLKALALDWQSALQELQPGPPMLGCRRLPPPIADFARWDLDAVAGTPVKKDPSVTNGSSIAFLAEFDGRSALLCGDAHADVLEKSLAKLLRERAAEGSRLKVDALKLSHHGSAHGTPSTLLQLLDCNRYLVSTNGNIFYHPDREAIARVIVHGGETPTLCFNYRTSYNALWDEQVLRERYRYSTRYPLDGEAGLRVSL